MPELRVVTVKELASERAAAIARGESAPDAGPEVAVIEVPGSGRERPGGKRFGELVHRILATVPLTADEAEIRAIAEVEARFLGAPKDEMEESARMVEQVLDQPLLRRAAAAAPGSGQVRREVPVLVAESPDHVVEGVLDLAFREETDGEGRWTVVDFKTDREIAGARPIYQEQAWLYGRAVERATGEKASSSVLVVSSRRETESPSSAG
jgi:ATP-dependent exoDNAse (exonuclease V) beta subunit